MQNPSLVLGSFLLSALGLGILISLAPSLGLVDHPDGNLKNHRKVTPVVGGIAIGLSWIATALFGGVPGLLIALVGVVLFFGVLDDLFSLSPLLRLILFFAVAGVWSVAEASRSGSTWIDWFAPFGIVAMIIAANIIDGIDGLCAGTVIVALIGLSLLSGSESISIGGLLLLSALIPFFLLNAYRARVFLGDAGSTVLGFLVAVLAIDRAKAAAGSPLVIVAILSALAFLLIEIGLTVVRRLANARNQSVIRGDRNHIYDWMTARIGATATLMVILLGEIAFLAAGLWLISEGQAA